MDDPQSPSGSTALAQFLQLDSRIVDFVSGEYRMDARLAGLCRLVRPSPQADPPLAHAAAAAGLWKVVEHHMAKENPDTRKLVLYLNGPHGAGKHELALHICRRLHASTLTLEAKLLIARATEAETLLRLAFREGLIHQAYLYVEHADVLMQEAARAEPPGSASRSGTGASRADQGVRPTVCMYFRKKPIFGLPQQCGKALSLGYG